MRGECDVGGGGVVGGGVVDEKSLKQFETFCTLESLRNKSKSVSTQQYVEKL